MIRKIKNKTGKIISLIAILQILLLIILTPAESYRIHQTDSSSNNVIIINDGSLGNNVKKMLGIGINLIVGFLSIKEIGFVSAAEVATSCCIDTCDDVISTFEGCTAELIPTACANTDECRKGCCFDPAEGLCSTNAPKGKCNSIGGEWSSDAICLTNKCRKGCCVIGSNANFWTEQQCKYNSQQQGVDEDFRQIWNELDCLAVTASNFEGACVLDGKNCKFESERQCSEDGGIFHQDYLCSNSQLDTKCEKQKTIDCIDGKDEIYWIDSCGNKENIYDSDKEKSWNMGKVLTKENSCEGNGIMGSTSCGNCEQKLSACSKTTGTEAHVTDGNFICKDLGCKKAIANVGTQDRVNGEKWCLYDGAIGDGKAVVGSEHWLAHCHNGEVSIDMCGDFRSSICWEQKIDDPNIPKGFTMAGRETNNPVTCLSITQDNSESPVNMTKECNKNSQCMMRQISVSDNFKFGMCIPKYPKGNDLASGTDGNGCALMNQKCAVVYENNGFGGWDCRANCQCESSEFAKQMNELCVSMGDCGSNINYLGKGTDNVEILGEKGKQLDSDGKELDVEGKLAASAPAIYSWTNYANNAKPVSGQYVDLKNMSDEMAITFGINNYVIGNSNIGNTIGMISGIGGGTAIGLTSLSIITGTLAPFFNAAGAILVGIALGNFLGKIMNKSPSQMAWLMIMGGVAGTGAIMLLSSGSVACATVYGCIIGGGLVLIAALYFLWSWLSGAGERETRIVEFKCQPWQAPNGGTDCDKCDDDPLKPCTAYRCSSLGGLCVIKNEGYTNQNPICFSLPKEIPGIPPVISAGEVKTIEYNFQNKNLVGAKIVRIDGSENGCVHSSDPILFTLNTDENSQCRYSFKIPNAVEYKEMNGEPLEENQFGKNHTFLFRIPSIDDANIYDLTQQTDAKGAIVKYGKLNVYFKCADAQEPQNYNIVPYVVNLCVNSGPDYNVVAFNKVIFSPVTTIFKFGTTEVGLKLGIPEPADCKYDTSGGKNYDSMQYSLDCKTGITDAGINGWPCSTKVNLIPGENKFYFKCKDKSGNINVEDFPHTIKVSEKELKIDSVTFMYGIQKISFGKEISAGLEPIPVNMEIKTSGGYNGKSYCSWGVSEKGIRLLIPPFDNAIATHNIALTEMRGSHFVFVDCQDDAGNEANTLGEFTISVDSLSPAVIRAYKDGENLKIITNELAKCYYNKNTCNFDLESTSATPMSSSYSTTQTAPWSQGAMYYIRCEDNFGNAAVCSGQISPG